MKITDGAKQFLENFLKAKGKDGIRIFSIARRLRITIFDELKFHRRNQIRLRIH